MGRVVSRLDGSVAGAEIWAEPEEGPGPRLVATADESGRYSAPLTEGTWWFWAVLREELGAGAVLRTSSTRYRVQASAEGAELDLVSPFPARMRGVVLGSGSPLAGATVHSVPIPAAVIFGSSGELEQPPHPRSCRTDDSGRFELPYATEGIQELWVEWRGAAVWKGQALASEDVRIEVPDPARVGGRLVHPQQGPVADVALELRVGADLPPRATRTDAQGRFRFTDVLPGPFALTSVLPGSAAGAGETLSLALEAAVGSGEELDLGELELSAHATIRGRATEAERGLANQIVLLRAATARSSLWPGRETRTAADGSFTFDACPPWKHELRLLGEEGATLARAIDVRAGGAPLTLAVADTAVLRGRRNGARPAGSGLVLRSPALHRPIEVQVGANETFELRLPVDSYEAFERIVGLGMLPLGRFQLGAGEVRELDIPPLATGALSVRVEFPAGSEHRTGVLFTVRGESMAAQFRPEERNRVARVDLAAGRIEAPALLQGSYSFDATSPDYGLVHRRFEVRAGEETQLEVALVPGTPLTVRCLTDQPLPPDPSFQYTLRSAALDFRGRDRRETLRSGADGEVLRIERVLAPDEYVLEVHAGALSGRVEFAAALGAPVALDLWLLPDGAEPRGSPQR